MGEDRPTTQHSATALAVAMHKQRPDLTLTQIAKILGVNLTTVSRAVKRAKKGEKHG